MSIQQHTAHQLSLLGAYIYDENVTWRSNVLTHTENARHDNWQMLAVLFALLSAPRPI